MKHSWYKTVALLTAAGTWMAVGEVSAETPKSGGTLRAGMARDVVNMEPWVAHGVSVNMIQLNVYETLIAYKPPNAEFEPQLAVSWEVVDPTTYVFNLREGVVFHDGDTFDAEDVRASLDRLRDPEGGASLAPQLKDIESVNVLGPHKIEVKLSQPNAVFLALMASTTAHMLSKEWLEEEHDLTQEMNGTGPFMFVEFEPGLHTILEKNPNYWKEGLPYLDRIVAVPFRDDSARINALRSNEAQFIEYVPWIDFDAVDADPDFSLHKGFTPFNLLRFNVKEPPFDNVLVRQAMNYLIDRDQLIKLAFGGEGIPMEVALTFPGTPYFNEDLKRWKYDPDKALELLKQAGYDSFADLSFVLKVASVTVHTDSAEAIQGMLQGLGVNVELEYMDIPTLLDHRKNGGYIAMMDGLSLSYFDPDAYSYYFESGATGHAAGAGFSDAKLDELLARGRVEIDFEKRRQIYREFEERLLDLAPWYFGFFRPQGEAMASFVKGYERLPGDLGTTSTSRFEYLWIDK